MSQDQPPVATFGNTQPLPSIPGSRPCWRLREATGYAAARDLRRKIDDDHDRLLKRVATIYLVAGLMLSIGVTTVAALELVGVNAFDGPPDSSAVQTFNENLIRSDGAAFAPPHQSPSELSAQFIALLRSRLGSDHTYSHSLHQPSTLPQTATRDSVRAVTRSSPQARDTFTPHPNSPVRRIEISAIGIDAPVVIRGLDESGMMETAGAFEVAWYEFASHPANRGNAVFSGHVDYADIGPAVFWELAGLQPDDGIMLTLADGSQLAYRVIAMMTIPAEADQIQLSAVVGPTPEPSLTLITCAGSFDSGLHRYAERLVVRAVRVDTP